MTGARLAAIIGELPRNLDAGICAKAPDPDLWHSVIWADQVAAKKVCGRCPVQAWCADWAIDSGQPHGIWGGFDEAERAAIARGQDAAAARRSPAHRQYNHICDWCGNGFVGKAARKYCGHSCAATHAAVMRRAEVAA